MLTRDARFSATLNEQPRTPRLAVAGEIDSATADRFDEALRAAVRRRPRLIVDLSEVEFLSSPGIGSLFLHLDHIVAVAVAPGSIIARALSLAGYPRMILHNAPKHPTPTAST